MGWLKDVLLYVGESIFNICNDNKICFKCFNSEIKDRSYCNTSSCV